MPGKNEATKKNHDVLETTKKILDKLKKITNSEFDVTHITLMAKEPYEIGPIVPNDSKQSVNVDQQQLKLLQLNPGPGCKVSSATFTAGNSDPHLRAEKHMTVDIYQPQLTLQRLSKL